MKTILLLITFSLMAAMPVTADNLVETPAHFDRTLAVNIMGMYEKVCPVIANVATDTGLGYTGLKTVTLNQIDAYFKYRLTSERILKIRNLIRISAAMCEGIAL